MSKAQMSKNGKYKERVSWGTRRQGPYRREELEQASLSLATERRGKEEGGQCGGLSGPEDGGRGGVRQRSSRTGREGRWIDDVKSDGAELGRDVASAFCSRSERRTKELTGGSAASAAQRRARG